MKLIDKILKFFGLCKYSALTNLQDAYNDLEVSFDAVNEKCDKYYSRIMSVEFKTMEEYKTNQEILDNKNRELEQTLKESTEFYKSVQTELSTGLIDFSKTMFPRSLLIPGSAEVTMNDIMLDEDSSYMKLTGRIIFDDYTTKRIQDEIDINKKVNIITSYMSKYGIDGMIITKLVKNGNIPIVLGYRDSNTVYEAYFTISMVNGTTVIDIKE